MVDETEAGPAGAFDGRGHPRGGFGDQSPLQARAQFLKNRSWELVISLNKAACARGGALHGFNQKTQETCKGEWKAKQDEILAPSETIDCLRRFHRSAPFFFFNGNAAEFQHGDRPRVLARGLIVQIFPVGRVAWRVDGSNSDLIAWPESVLRIQP